MVVIFQHFSQALDSSSLIGMLHLASSVETKLAPPIDDKIMNTGCLSRRITYALMYKTARKLL